MDVKQIYTLMNTVTKEVTGKENLVAEDLTNIVDVGKEILDSASVDSYVRSLVNHIGKVIFVDRVYSGNVPSMLMDSWEFGSVLEKITADIPEASENESWNLQDGQTYNQDIFHKPVVSAKFFNSKVTFEVPMSFTELQVKQSFSNSAQLNGFLSMLHNAVEKSMTVKMDSLIMRTINNMIAETVYNDLYDKSSKGIVASGVTGTRAVNLLHKYNTEKGTALTADKALTDKEFIRYASFQMSLYIDRLSKISTLFNVGGKERFTPADMLNIVMLSDFKAGAVAYLQSDTFHDNYVALPESDTVPYWQGSGVDYDFATTSKINVKTSEGHAVEFGGILAVMYDRDSMGVTNLDRRVTTNYNAKGEFFNNYYKFDAGYFNDLNENFVVFYVA